MKQEEMKEQCPHNLDANAEICPLAIPTHLRPETSLDDLKSFFSTFVERDLPELTNVTPGQIVMLLDAPNFQSGSFDEKCNAVVDLHVQGMLEKRAEMLRQ